MTITKNSTIQDIMGYLNNYYGYAIEVYPVQKDYTTYIYMPLHTAKEIIKGLFRFELHEYILKDIEENKTLFSGIDSKNYRKIDLDKLAEIIKEYL